MKKTLFILAIALGLLTGKSGQAQSVDTMLIQTYTAFDTAKTYPQLLMASNQFKLIAKQSPTYWLANYYAAWSIAILSFQEPDKDKKDPMLDEADAFFKKIEPMDSSNDEVALLGSLLASARLSVDPAKRHGQYGKISEKYQAMVTRLNPNNPRLYYMQGNSKFYTPKMWGGGVEKAQPLYEKAETLFANDSQDIHKPHWGKAINEKMLAQCKEKEKK
ncbi:MAG: hypothetical protein ACLQQ4_19035 [Bacteroidia bacterium]